MNLLLLTWNGTSINNGTPFYSDFPPGTKVNIHGNVVTAPRAGNYPFLSNIVADAQALQIRVRIAPGQNIDTNREALKQYFNYEDGRKHTLIAEDGSGGTQWYVTGFVRDVRNEAQNRNSFLVLFALDYPYWQLVTAGDTTWTITASGQTAAVTNAGNINAKPKFTFVPTTAKTAGLKYRRWVSMYNNTDKSFIAPYDITNGGLDTAALVASTSKSNQINEGAGINAVVTTWNIDTSVGGGLPTTGGSFYMGTEQCTYTLIAAGVISGVTRGVSGTTAATHADNVVMYLSKVQADGHDLLVWRNGHFIDRWLYNINAATTQCWENVNLAPRTEGTTLGNVAASGAISSITFTKTKANLRFLQKLKQASNRIILIDNEAFLYTAANINLVTYTITSPTRAQKGTAEAAHVAPKTVRHIESDEWVLYGDSTLSAPDVDDDNKPIFSLASLNTSWVFANYFDEDNSRPGAWKGEVLASRTGLSYVFTDDSNTFDSPSTKLGLALIGSADFQVQNETGTLAWSLTHPAGITDVTFSGDKYRSGSWPAIVGLQYLQDNTAWFTADNQAQPVSAYTWESFGPTTIALGGTYNTIRFAIDGLLSSVIGEMALIQFDTVTAAIASGSLPAVSIGAEAACNFFDFTLTNNTTGEYIKCQVPCGVNETLTIDCETKEAYLSDGQRVAVTTSTDRTEWLDMRPGANTFQFDDVGTVAITAHIYHRDRTL